ncbi:MULTISPECIES: hypothetical protein [Neobacillus]|uniref:Uncharacterized protein n=1 Tax=Neobacillus rhizophilus TaxID=2833579 RepID=A0A942U1N0_9BACI|nr:MULTISPECIES: hypothetical protein [Neobacillus]MBS4212920.1 hypothetical protein [Neobacillus rhizophilus]MBU8918136.1 hypothetical protein [Bacillus sp. FJAT-29953]
MSRFVEMKHGDGSRASFSARFDAQEPSPCLHLLRKHGNQSNIIYLRLIMTVLRQKMMLYDDYYRGGVR